MNGGEGHTMTPERRIAVYAAISATADKFKDPLIWFTALLVVVGALQWWTLKKSDETLKAEQRPWIELNPVIDGDLVDGI
jgi:hypothetical protein